MNPRALRTLLAAGLLFTVGACDGSSSTTDGDAPILLEDAQLYACDGSTVSLLDWVKAHEVSYIGFAAGWCGACKEEVPRLNDELVAPNGDEVGVSQIIMEDVNADAPTEALCAGWKEDLEADYDILIDKDGALLEPFFGGGPISQLPVHLIVTGDGVIRYQLAADLPTDIADKVTLWLSE